MVSHHDFGSVHGSCFESKEEALQHWKGLSLFEAHMLLGAGGWRWRLAAGPDGKELRYYGRRGGRDAEMRQWAGW